MERLKNKTMNLFNQQEYDQALAFNYNNKELFRVSVKRSIELYSNAPNKTEKALNRLKKYKFWLVLLDREILDRIDNIEIGGTASDDKWVEKADLDGEPMSIETIQNLTEDQHAELILKAQGVLQ